MIRRRALALLLALVVALGVLSGRVEAARDMVRASVEFVEWNAPVSAVPFTMACWANCDDAANLQTAMAMGTSGSGQLYAIQFSGSTGGDPITFQTAVGTATTSTGYTVGTWHHVAAVAASVTDRSVYIDGGSKGTNTASAADLDPDKLRLGSRVNASANPFDGRAAHGAVWNVALTDDEVLALAKGAHPYTIRRQSLVFYAPIHGDASPEMDLVGGLSGTVTGTTKADSFPIRRP